MNKGAKQLSNSFSTGGGGPHFEAHIQASFVTLMLTGGYAPCLPCWPITEIKLQGKNDGYDTDDLIVFVEKNDTKEKKKLIGQVKHSIHITQRDSVFLEIIQAAWNDFNNPHVFTKSEDIIALITGPLSGTDARNMPWLLDQAKHTSDADEFYRNVEQAYFGPTGRSKKLEVIQHHLKLANNNSDVSKDELYSFLNHFHLLQYDLGKEVGVVLSLLHSHISQFSQQDPKWIWSRIVDIVQTWNQNAGTITKERLPEDLKEAFKQPVPVHIPEELTRTQSESMKTDWNQHQYATDLALANLVGAWNENNEADICMLSKLTDQSYTDWISKARGILQHSNSPIALREGLWKITERASLWDTLGPRVFDDHLDTFRKSAVEVLSERDPSFELSMEERYAASIHGKVLTRSPALRDGLAEGLAILGSRHNALTNCSLSKRKATADWAIDEIFKGADWVLWGSLNGSLPALAEAAPDKFLKAVENALRSSPCPFDELFSQKGMGGSNYLTGLLWALERLAWDSIYLVRVCVILGELASRDPSGNWANQPNGSLSRILLPWFPQTTAPIEKRKAAVQTLCDESPEIAWKLIINLLPDQVSSTVGTNKPLWGKTIPEDWKEGAIPQEYWAQISFYAELAVLMAGYDTVKLGELLDLIDKLPKTSFDKLLEVLSSDTILGLPEEKKLHLWDRATKLVSRHRRFSDAEWAIDEDLLSSIDQVADRLAPLNPSSLYQRLFSNQALDLYEVYEENDNWEEQERKIEECRQEAVRRILELSGIKSVIQFAESVDLPRQVGHSLGCVANVEIDTVLFPAYIRSENRKLSSFINGYIWIRHCTNGWPWADELDKSGWDNEQISQFLSALPFTNGTWDRAAEWLGDAESEYWRKTDASLYQENSDLGFAIDKLIRYERPYAAINWLYYRMRYTNQSTK